MKTKKQLTNRILSLVLTFVMVLGMLPMSSFTAFAAERGAATTVDLSSLTATYAISDSGEYTFEGSGSYGIKVESGNPTIVLNNASITVGKGSSAIDVASGSNATIFVMGNNTVDTDSELGRAGGIFVAEGGTVNITSNSNANILRVHGSHASAIGGKYDYDNNESYNAGSINISNVTVYAYTNNFYASAIGAAGEGTCGTINITNAVIYAYGAGDKWTSAPGIGSALSLTGWPETIPVVIISDSEIHTFRYNPYSDYIGYLGDEYGEEGGFHATGSINCGEGGSIANSTIYCYTGLDATTTDKTVKYGALGGLLKEDGTCEGEHTGIICDNCGYCSCTHEGGELTYALTEDGTQHTATWSCCGATVTEDHTPDETIGQTCMGYTCTVCEKWYGEKVADAHTAEPTYTPNAEDSTKHDVTYDCCGATVTEPHDHTNGKCVCGVKATPIVTAPTGISGLVYTGEALALVGAGSTTGGTLQYSLDNAAWSTEIPTATNAGDYTVYYKVVGGENYEDVAAQSINVTIIDKTEPLGNILIKENGWNKFWNTITFGIFCKDYVDVTITADGTGSGVAKVEYLLSETAIDKNNIPTDGWTVLTKDGDTYKFQIQPQNKVAVYVRITDEGGNVTVINSDGIVVYEDSEAVTTAVTYTYKENSNKDIAVEFNGNTVRSIACGEKVLAANTDYSVDYESGKIALKSTYLDTLSAGNYTFTVSYNPMGVENSGVTDLTTTFTVKVEPTSIAGATVSVTGTFTYDGNAKTPDPVVVLNGETLIKDQDYTVSYNNNTNATNDGKATVIVTGKGNYTGSVNGSFEIDRAKLTDVSVQQNGKLTYDGGKALTPAVTANATALNGAKVLFMYSADGTTYGSMPTFTEAGTYTVYYQAYTTDNNFIDQYDTFTVTIDKAIVTEPAIASKPYNNSAQTADISDTDLYTVVKNEGGTEKGSYDVVLKLKDSANYKWSTTDNAEVTLQFVISAAQNSWDTKPAISGWTYGETANAPTYKAKFGTVKVVYSGIANDGTDYNSETAPTKAGSYTATFTVEGTEDYSGLSEQVNFTIAKKAVTITANDASKTYGDSDPTFTYTHTELVGADALVITVARASGENANTYTITASQAEGANPNYEITFKTGTFTIHKAALIVTVEDKTATYGDAVPNYTVKYDGFKNSDDKDDLGGTLAFDCDYAQFSDKGEYTIKTSGYTSGNYTINYVDGKLNVSAKPITVTIQNATSIYGEALAELKATDNGIVNNDKDVYSLATVATSTSNVGMYAITGNALDSNYAISFVNGEYEITKREITITVEAKNAIVNTALPTYTYKVEGLVGEDKLETEPTLTSNADITVIGEYDITATGADAGGNYSIKYVPAKLTVLTDNAVDAAAGYTEELKGYDPATVTSEDKAELDEILNEINTILEDENITDNGKKALEEVKEQVEKLIKEITDAADATDTENVGKVENVTQENVTPENKTDLEGAKADLEKALEDHGSNMTEDEKKAVEDEIKRIDDALEVIGNVEAVEELIDKLPDTIKKDDEAAIKAADDAYNALSDYEKSLVGKDAKKALDDAKAALAELNKPADNTSPDTGDNSHMMLWIALLFISGGAVITLTVVDRKRRTVSKR